MVDDRMIDLDKYLYWLSDDNINTDEIVFREMYSRIGYLLHVIQMIEYNIANILSLEEFENQNKEIFTFEDVDNIRELVDDKFNSLSNLTFGNLNKQVKSSKYLSKIDKEELKNIKEYRDFLVHRCFKEKLLNDSFKSIDQVEAFIDELNDYESRCKNMNEELINIYNANKSKNILVVG